MSAEHTGHSHAAQFKVLVHVFSVLRHDATQPIANAKLAVAMLGRPATITDDDAGERHQSLVRDLDSLLDETTAALRTLDEWFADHGEYAPLCKVADACRRLLFRYLLRSGKQIALAQPAVEAAPVNVFEARYVLLSGMLQSLQALPPGGTLQLSIVNTAIDARAIPPDEPPQADRRTAIMQPAITAQEAADIAQQFAWQLTGDATHWRAQPPATA